MRKDEPFYLLTQYAKKSDIRRVWFGSRKNLNDSQRVWARYMLMTWGKVYGGNIDYGGESSVIGRLMMRSEWNENEGTRIIKVVNDYFKKGYRGEELFKISHQTLNAKVSDLIALAKESDDAAFIEMVINKTFKLSNPIRHVAIKRYCDCKYTQKMARELRFGQDVSIQQCTRRIEWALEILEEELYYAIKREGPE